MADQVDISFEFDIGESILESRNAVDYIRYIELKYLWRRIDDELHD